MEKRKYTCILLQKAHACTSQSVRREANIIQHPTDQIIKKTISSIVRKQPREESNDIEKTFTHTHHFKAYVYISQSVRGYVSVIQQNANQTRGRRA